MFAEKSFFVDIQLGGKVLQKVPSIPRNSVLFKAEERKGKIFLEPKKLHIWRVHQFDLDQPPFSFMKILF